MSERWADGRAENSSNDLNCVTSCCDMHRSVLDSAGRTDVAVFVLCLYCVCAVFVLCCCVYCVAVLLEKFEKIEKIVKICSPCAFVSRSRGQRAGCGTDRRIGRDGLADMDWQTWIDILTEDLAGLVLQGDLLTEDLLTEDF